MKRYSVQTIGMLAILMVSGCGPLPGTKPTITATVRRSNGVVPFSTANPDVLCWPGSVCIYNIDFNPNDATAAGVHWKGVFLAIDDQLDVGPSPYFEYNMRYGFSGDEPNWQQINFGGDVHDVALHNLQPNRLYGVIVEGHEGEGSSQWSPWSGEVLFQTASQGGTVTVQGSGFPAGASVLVALQSVPNSQGALRSIGPFVTTVDLSGNITEQIRYGVCLPSIDISRSTTTITAVEQSTFTGAVSVPPIPNFCGSANQVPDLFSAP